MESLLDNRCYRAMCIAFFAIVLLGPITGSLLGIGTAIRETELRNPAPAPSVPQSLGDLAGLPDAIDAYLNDRLGFRSPLISLNSLLHYAIGVSGSPRYIVGRDGWLFHRTAQIALEQVRGVDRFTEAELEAWVDTMEARQRWLAERGIEFLVVIAPSKPSIYPERLPGWVNRVGTTRYEQLASRLAAGSPLEWIDLREPLLRAKSDDLVYFRTDGHWNDLGAFVAYREIAAWMQRRHPELEPLTFDRMSLGWESRLVGTIARALNLSGLLAETVPVLEPRDGSRAGPAEQLGRGPEFAAGSILRIRSDVPGGLRVLFIRDSYATHLARYLSESVGEIWLVHHRQGRFDKAFIERHQPDVVIYEMMERGLIWKQEPIESTRSRRR